MRLLNILRRQALIGDTLTPSLQRITPGLLPLPDLIAQGLDCISRVEHRSYLEVEAKKDYT